MADMNPIQLKTIDKCIFFHTDILRRTWQLTVPQGVPETKPGNLFINFSPHKHSSPKKKQATKQHNSPVYAQAPQYLWAELRESAWNVQNNFHLKLMLLYFRPMTHRIL